MSRPLASAFSGSISTTLAKTEAASLSLAASDACSSVRAVVGRVMVVDLVALQREVELGHVEVDEEAWLGSGLGLG